MYYYNLITVFPHVNYTVEAEKGTSVFARNIILESIDSSQRYILRTIFFFFFRLFFPIFFYYHPGISEIVISRFARGPQRAFVRHNNAIYDTRSENSLTG